MIDRQTSILAQLQNMTRDCRADMHEPDELALTAKVTGTQLDNAFGNDEDNTHEIVVTLTLDGASMVAERERFNLCDLIALARKAKVD